jgi:hypothetical protein
VRFGRPDPFNVNFGPFDLRDAGIVFDGYWPANFNEAMLAGADLTKAYFAAQQRHPALTSCPLRPQK